MNKSLNITINGGTVALGSAAVAEGGSIQGSAQIIQENLDFRYSKAYSSIEQTAKELGKSHTELQTALQCLDSLKSQVAEGKAEPESGKKLLQTVRENASWAYPIVKDFLTAVWPGLLAAIGA